MNEDLTDIGFGSIPSPRDYRDIAFASVADPIALPSKYLVDISNLPVWHQRKIGACVGHGTGKYKQKLDELDTHRVYPLSARFIYGVCKCLDGYDGEGTYPRLSMKVLKDYGCATEDALPNDTTLDHATYILHGILSNFEPYFLSAAAYKISSYAAVNVSVLSELKNAIIQGNGVSTLVQVGKEWYTDKNGNVTWNKDAILPIRAPKEIISGHQIYVYGYEDVGNDTKIYFLNSWSKDWADNGKGWFWWSEYSKFVIEGYTAIDVPQNLLDNAHELPPSHTFKYNFARSMQYGDSNIDVKNLQIALQIDGVFANTQKPTGYYGTITSNAVLAFQKKHKVASLTELLFLRGRKVGPKTLSKLNELYNK